MRSKLYSFVLSVILSVLLLCVCPAAAEGVDVAILDTDMVITLPEGSAYYKTVDGMTLYSVPYDWSYMGFMELEGGTLDTMRRMLEESGNTVNDVTFADMDMIYGLKYDGALFEYTLCYACNGTGYSITAVSLTQDDVYVVTEICETLRIDETAEPTPTPATAFACPILDSGAEITLPAGSYLVEDYGDRVSYFLPPYDWKLLYFNSVDAATLSDMRSLMRLEVNTIYTITVDGVEMLYGSQYNGLYSFTFGFVCGGKGYTLTAYGLKDSAQISEVLSVCKTLNLPASEKPVELTQLYNILGSGMSIYLPADAAMTDSTATSAQWRELLISFSVGSTPHTLSASKELYESAGMSCSYIDADGVSALLCIGYFDASGYTFMTLYNYGGKGYQITSTGLTQEEGDVVAQILDTLHVTSAPATPTPAPTPTPTPTPAPASTPDPDGFTILDGVLLSYTGTKTNVVVPKGVTIIGEKAFSGCSSITSVVLPEGVTTIGNNAFYACTRLVNVTLPQSLTTISTYAFFCCFDLEEIVLPDHVTSIGDSAFYGCNSLASVRLPKYLTQMGMTPFGSCGLLTELTVPGSVRGFGYNAFMDIETVRCYRGSYAEIEALEAGCAVEYIDKACTTSLMLPASLDEIEKEAFRGLAAEQIILPEGVKTIGAAAFADCPNLVRAYIPASVTDIADDAFLGSEDALIYTSATGSTAMAYAMENGMEYVLHVE